MTYPVPFVEFLSDPRMWPLGNRCPVKNWEREAETLFGIIYPGELIVRLEDGRSMEYASYEAMQADGWYTD
jgi:hypothetical protein